VCITIDWRRSLSDSDVIPITVSGPLFTNSTDRSDNQAVVVVTKRDIGGITFKGVGVYKNQYDASRSTADILVEFLQIRESPNDMRLHLSCKVPVQLKINNFSGSIIDISGGGYIKNPTIIPRGDYELHASQ
jgi:hypothetical protein